MHIVEFEYGSHKRLKVPIVPLQLESKGEWHEVWAFADSGATYSIFEEKEAERLGVKVASGRKIMAQVGDRSFIPIYLHKLRVKIGEFVIEAEIGFSRQLGIGFNLLGRRSIFEEFKVCFNDREEKVTFEELERR